MASADMERFLASLEEAAPPAGSTPPLRSLRHGLRGEWDAAHAIVQELDDANAAWVHAWLHRVEGDLANAGYWYRRAGRRPATGAGDDEGQDIAAALLGG